MPGPWDDEEPNWEVEEPTPPAMPADAPAAGEAKKEGEAPADGAAPAEAAAEDPDSLENKKYNRSRGVARDIPRPQTWAERALRTYNQKLHATETAIKTKTNDQIIHSLHHTRAMMHHRTTDYYHRAFTITY